MTIVLLFITYPVLNALDPIDFQAVYSAQLWSIYLVFGLVMLAELVSGLFLLQRIGDYQLHSLLRSGMVIILTIWLITLVFEVPNQFSLSNGYSRDAYVNIIFSNVSKLVLWLLRTILVTRMIKFFYGYDTAYDYEEFS